MSYILYLVVLIVSISSVVFGVDWLAKAPQPSPPATQTAMVRSATPARAKTADNKAKLIVTDTAKPDAATAATADTPTRPVAGNKTAVAVSQASNAPACNVQACEAAYHTFRASDCTYQPYDGPRRFCNKGAPKHAMTRTAAAETMNARASAQASSCNIRACEQAYQTFDPSDCTYQPYDGPRRLCER
jgi:cytoskeletal protein RodZ